MRKGIASSMPKAYFNIGGRIRTFAATVGNGISHSSLPESRLAAAAIRYEHKAPIRVASEPKIISKTAQLVSKFDKIQPTQSPATASGKNAGRTQSISERRS